jgi:hypothetical protein
MNPEASFNRVSITMFPAHGVIPYCMQSSASVSSMLAMPLAHCAPFHLDRREESGVRALSSRE